MNSENRIKILPEETVNRIAAGEVVERPASVVKELIENSLDAESKSISVEVKKAGKKLIEVSDDGRGMSPEDAKIACEPHSTSKISSSEDLQQVLTLGFRGEALSSIASVSQMEIVSCIRPTEGAVDLKFEGGKLVDEKISGRSKGTTVKVSNLFYNTPARRKFFKTDTTELSHIINVVIHFILAFPEVEFKLTHGPRELFHVTSSMTLQQRIREVLGKEVSKNLLKVSFEDSLFHLWGFISKPTYTRKDRRHQMFFVNKRYVQNATLSHALYEGYSTLVERGKYPAAILFMEISPRKIDVNIHPRKLEIKFLPNKKVHDKFQYAINQTIQNYKKEKYGEEEFDVKKKSGSFSYSKSDFANRKDVTFGFKQKEGIFSDLKYDNIIQKTESNVFQIQDTYIVNILPNKIKITDQHAAHERILFENFSKTIENKKMQKQNLLLPVRLDLSQDEFILLNEYVEFFNNMGFDIDIFGKNSFNIQAVPAILKDSDIKKIFLNILDDLHNLNKEKGNLTDELLKITSCHSAIRAGESLSDDEIGSLLRDLGKCELPFTCPHGRPTQIEIGVRDLEKKFRRK